MGLLTWEAPANSSIAGVSVSSWQARVDNSWTIQEKGCSLDPFTTLMLSFAVSALYIRTNRGALLLATTWMRSTVTGWTYSYRLGGLVNSH